MPGEQQWLLFAVALLMLGFSAKAGMFPLHGWLPAAHPVAPAPASAVLSGIITKAGVLDWYVCCITFVGPEFVHGTWVQSGYLALTLVTVLMGSMMAYYEPVLKKRLAYSTVSQVSYVLFGNWLLHPVGLAGALSHVVFHAVIKCGLFLAAGALIYQTGRTRVADSARRGQKHAGYTRKLCAVCACTRRYPACERLPEQMAACHRSAGCRGGNFGWLGPVILLVSALLTAGRSAVSSGQFVGSSRARDMKAV